MIQHVNLDQDEQVVAPVAFRNATRVLTKRAWRPLQRCLKRSLAMALMLVVMVEVRRVLPRPLVDHLVTQEVPKRLDDRCPGSFHLVAWTGLDRQGNTSHVEVLSTRRED